MKPIKIEKGYYWVRCGDYIQPAEYEGELCDDGSKNTYPWNFIASDEIYKWEEVDEVIERIEEPKRKK